MATKVLKTLRNNWKKTVFFTSAFSYGTYYLIERKYNAELLQAYCYEALKYSREKIAPEQTIRRVTIFLNPIANRERGKYLFDKNVAPILNLSGLDVRLIRLDKNSEANEYMKEIDLNDTDAIVVAGGNATVNEVISGLVHREDSVEFLKRIPIGVIPIGETNNFARKWLGIFGAKRNDEAEFRLLADSALAIIKGK
jgi:acylglycerol kinase